jgi:hypothetical protein
MMNSSSVPLPDIKLDGKNYNLLIKKKLFKFEEGEEMTPMVPIK